MNNPKLIPAPFAINGQKNSIPDRFSIELPSNTATWDQGFPPITTIPAIAGGLPPIGQDFNGIFNQVSENIVFLAEGGRYKFSEEHAVSIGGYKQGAILQSDDNLSEYQSLIDGNMVNFNTAPSGEITDSWKKIFPIALSSAINSTSETTAATSKAVKDALGSLGTTATKDIGNGIDQIPDMSFFSSTQAPSYSIYKFPNNLIVQIFTVTAGSSIVTPMTYPVVFPNTCHGIFPTYNSGETGNMYTFTNRTASGANMMSFVAGSSSAVVNGGTATVLAVGY